MKLGEGIGSELSVVRTTHLSLLVDPDDGGHVHDVIALGQDVLRVDQAGMGGIRALDEGSRVVEATVECNGDGNEVLGTQLFVQRLPDRQVLAAASPGGIGDE